MSDVEIRPLTEADAATASALSDRVWRAYGLARGRPERPPPSEEQIARSQLRLARQAVTDSETSHAAWHGDRLVGLALARRREGLWGLSLLIVDPDEQSRGLGRLLLDAALDSAVDAEIAMIVSSEDPRAMARYRYAGFRLHPTLRAAGHPPPESLPAVAGAREGTPADLESIGAVGRRLRGAGYGPDLELLAELAGLVVVERGGRLGWAFVDGAEIAQAGGTDAEVARDALLAGLATADPDAGIDGRNDGLVVRQLTAEQDWAIDAALTAGLRLEPSGPLCVRGAPPPRPYLPHGQVF